MKNSRRFRMCQMIAVLSAALMAFSCEKPDTPEPPQNEQEVPGTSDGKEEQSFSITAPESEFYQIEVPQTAKEGEDVTVTVTPVENVTIVAVRYNSRKADLVEENVYTFKMPEKDVKLKVESSSTVTVVPSSYFTSKADKETAQAGDLVTVSFYVSNIEDIISSATVNGTTECKLEAMDLGEYTYSFTMPEGPAVVEAHLLAEYHVIEREWDDHCVISMLDCINNQGKADEFCSQKEGFPVHFIYKCDLGYDVACTVTGKESGKDYTGEIFWSLAADNHLYQDCWAFYMPDEPVVIKTVSTERNTYEGADFVGEYKGYWVTLGENSIYSSSDPSLNMELCSNEAYFVSSTDKNAYEFAGIYTVNNGTLAGNRDESRGDYALRGQLLENGYAFAIIDNLLHDNVDNRRFYLVGKEDFGFVCATDKSGNRYLLETESSGRKSWYFIERDNQSIKKAEVSFTSGSSLNESCVAMVDVIGGIEFNRTDRFRYTYENGGAPVFTYSGKEAGTYISDKGETLELDGFGNAEYNGIAGAYTIEAGLVTYTDAAGNNTKFNINMNDKTFVIITEGTGIALDPVYSTSTAWISVDGQQSETGMVTVAFDVNYGATAVKEGYAFIQINYIETGKVKEMIGANCPYYTDAENRTVTISNVLQGNGGWGTTKKDIVLNISEDGKTLTFADEAIYSTSSPYVFCYGQEYAPIYSETK